MLDTERLASLLEAETPVAVEPLPTTLGYSGARFYRATADGADGFLVKETVLAEDWFSHRTEDRVGREARALLAPELELVHEIFALPYRAVATEPGRIGLLMEDVSPWLLPDERAPIDPDHEGLILDTLAQLHAAFWRAPELERLGWLQGPSDFLHIMGPRGHDEEEERGGSARRVNEAIRAGWREAHTRLPDPIRRALWRPAAEIAAPWADLPHTLVHGDSKVANFAVLPDARLCALDWAFVGRAPCTFEIGWYVAVNAPRLAGSKADTFRRYRTRLEGHLGRALDDALWERLQEAGVVCGALMLLWSKASAVAAGRNGAEAEWAWWEARLAAWARSSAGDRRGDER